MRLPPPTPEQIAIHEDNSNILCVRARAGSGKTTSLIGYAAARPDQRLLYICFSKAIQMEAAKKFPKNTDCRTMHSIAFGPVGRKYAQKLCSKLAAYEIVRELGGAMVIAQYAIATVVNYTTSAERELSGTHVPDKVQPMDAVRVLELAHRIWAGMCDEHNKTIRMTHDGYLKLFQLGAAYLGNYDGILLDEFQDTNPVTLDIFLRQSCRKVMVGDEYQSIFAFRNAVNALDSITPDRSLYLTQSFRFGEGIANMASGLLRCFFDEKIGVIGKGKHPTTFNIDFEREHGILCRTNAGVFEAAVFNIDTLSLHFIGGVENYQFQNVLDAWWLYSRAFGEIKNPLIRAFGSYSEMKEYAEAVDDKELISLTRVVEKYGSDIPALVDRVQREALREREGSLVQICTAHRSKGLEFDQVVLWDDYGTLIDDKTGYLMTPKTIEEREEIHLLYVALTRAIRVIQLNTTIREWLDLYSKEIEQNFLTPPKVVPPSPVPEAQTQLPLETALPESDAAAVPPAKGVQLSLVFQRDLVEDAAVLDVLGLTESPEVEDWLQMQAVQRNMSMSDTIHQLLKERMAS